MLSDLDMRSHKGHEFTSFDDRHMHCVVIDLLHGSMSYLANTRQLGEHFICPSTYY